MASKSDAALREHVVSLLTGGHAHAMFEDAVKDLPVELRGKTPKGAEHSPWEAARTPAACAVGHPGVFAGSALQVAEVSGGLLADDEGAGG